MYRPILLKFPACSKDAEGDGLTNMEEGRKEGVVLSGQVCLISQPSVIQGTKLPKKKALPPTCDTLPPPIVEVSTLANGRIKGDSSETEVRPLRNGYNDDAVGKKCFLIEVRT